MMMRMILLMLLLMILMISMFSTTIAAHQRAIADGSGRRRCVRRSCGHVQTRRRQPMRQTGHVAGCSHDTGSGSSSDCCRRCSRIGAVDQIGERKRPNLREVIQTNAIVITTCMFHSSQTQTQTRNTHTKHKHLSRYNKTYSIIAKGSATIWNIHMHDDGWCLCLCCLH